MTNKDDTDSRESPQVVEERSRTVLDFGSDVDLREALLEAVKEKENPLSSNPAELRASGNKLKSVMVGCFESTDQSNVTNAIDRGDDVCINCIERLFYLYCCII